MLNMLAITNSATESEEAAGVFATFKPFSFAYSASILSIPTPPLTTNFKFAQLSIMSFLTFVALLTVSTSIEFELI